MLDEIGIDLNSTLLHAPGAKSAQPVQQVGSISSVISKKAGASATAAAPPGCLICRRAVLMMLSLIKDTASISACSCTSNSAASRMSLVHASM